MKNPNLFDYATKELSQDAVICWLLKCAEYSDDLEINSLGRKFVHELLNHKRNDNQVTLGDNEIKVEIWQQHKSIDVLARINEKYVLLIEDKTGSNPHSNQLENYRNSVLNGGTVLGEVRSVDLFPIYLKTWNHSMSMEKMIEDRYEYKVFDRENFISVLDTYAGKNPIICNFLEHLKCISLNTNKFRDWIKSDKESWEWSAWEGLFRALEEELADNNLDPEWDGWDYVHNPSGGFLGFWWSKNDLPEGHEVYIQLEHEKLCFKVWAGEASSEKKNELKWRWNERITRQSKSIVTPDSMRIGKSMTVAMHKCGWLRFDENGKFDLDRSIVVLKEAAKILTEAVKG